MMEESEFEMEKRVVVGRAYLMILTSRSENTGPMDCGVMSMNCLPQASLAAEICIFRQGDQQMTL